MKRILSVMVAGFIGATVGYVVHQVLDMQKSPDGVKTEALVIGAPPLTAAVAALVGIIFGRSRVGAFLVGAVVAAAAGDALDRAMPPMADLRNRVMALKDARTAT